MGKVTDVEIHRCALEKVPRYSGGFLENLALATRTRNLSLKSCCVALLKIKLYMPDPSKSVIQPEENSKQNFSKVNILYLPFFKKQCWLHLKSKQ